LTRRNAFNVVFETIKNFSFKIKMLHQHFFLNTTKTNFNDLQKFNYRVFVEKSIINIQKDEIMQIIKRCKSNNVLKFDDISNKILKILCANILLLLINLFRACVELSYHFFCFRIAHIIVFKKFNKKNFSNVKTYKFIILLNKLNKILKSIITRRINILTKTHDMLSISQMSDRKNKNCETALKLFIEQIHIVWNMKKDKITTFLSMNIIVVYDHMFKNKMLHNLRKKNISNWIIRWTNNFMKDKHISLTLSNAMMTFCLIKTNISQKSFIFSILYLFYNVELLKIFEKLSRRITIVNFVNDINFLIYDIFTKQNCSTLKRFHQEWKTWNRRHEIVFASIKYELIHLTKNHRKFNMQIELRIEAIQKTSALYVRVLSVQMNNKLKWKSHVRAIQKKIDYANNDFIAFHDVYVKSMFRTRSSDLFVNCQTRNHLRQFRLICVAWAIEQRQRNDDTIHENTKSRFAYRFRRFSNHFSENIERKNACSIHSFAFVLFANYNSKSIE
jgi:hypothetical protein